MPRPVRPRSSSRNFLGAGIMVTCAPSRHLRASPRFRYSSTVGWAQNTILDFGEETNCDILRNVEGSGTLRWVWMDSMTIGEDIGGSILSQHNSAAIPGLFSSNQSACGRYFTAMKGRASVARVIEVRYSGFALRARRTLNHARSRRDD
jgi:hypothetical protein